MRYLLGELHAARVASMRDVTSLRQVEFGVYSQWGEDGILEHILSRVPVTNETFVEFGVEDYQEANTRFLLRRRNWSGLVIDGSSRNIQRLRSDPLFTHHDLRAVAAVVTAENIDSLLTSAGISGDIGLLSIDIDGNDYWVWQAISTISPRVVVCEYNSVFGDIHAVTVPYDPHFERQRAHHSRLFFGASLPALRELATRRGYAFVGCNSAGVNAFFVRGDCADALSGLAAHAAYVPSRFRESTDEKGAPTFLAGPDRVRAIADCVVYDLRQGKEVRIRDLQPPLL